MSAKASDMTKNWHLIFVSIIICLTCISIIIWKKKTLSPIKIGILHSLSGDLAISEKPVADATLLAIDEINKAGGILGRKIEPILLDGESNTETFAAQAERLITQEKVIAIFGCWTSPSRIAVKKVVEKYNSLLFYSVQFEGLELSNNVVYIGTTPNQQIIPGVTWCIQHLGKKFFLVGTDRILHEIIKDIVHAHEGEIVGTEYLALHDKNVAPIIEKIIATKPDVILNNIEGEANIAFFTELRKKGITPEKIPTMSFSISEPELQLFNIETMIGDYATWSYFESIDSHENKIFLKKFEAMYGKEQRVSDAMEAVYFTMFILKQAIEKAGSLETDLIRTGIYNQAFNAPQGLVHIAQNSLHTWSTIRVGKIRSDKQFTVLWNSQKSVMPMAYPISRSIDEWDALATTIRKMRD